jgi:hypothetical protein
MENQENFQKDNYKNMNMLYIGFIGFYNGNEPYYKYGITKDLLDRISQHIDTYKRFILIYSVECNNTKISENIFTRLLKEKKLHRTLLLNQKHKEIFTVDDFKDIKKDFDKVVYDNRTKIEKYHTVKEQKLMTIINEKIQLIDELKIKFNHISEKYAINLSDYKIDTTIYDNQIELDMKKYNIEEYKHQIYDNLKILDLLLKNNNNECLDNILSEMILRTNNVHVGTKYDKSEENISNQMIYIFKKRRKKSILNINTNYDKLDNIISDNIEKIEYKEELKNIIIDNIAKEESIMIINNNVKKSNTYGDNIIIDEKSLDIINNIKKDRKHSYSVISRVSTEKYNEFIKFIDESKLLYNSDTLESERELLLKKIIDYGSRFGKTNRIETIIMSIIHKYNEWK